MSNKIKPKFFISILVLLIVATVLTIFLNKRKVVNHNLADIHIGLVEKIEVKLPGSAKTIAVTKENNSWYVTQGNARYKADIRIVANYLNKIGTIQQKKVITRKKRDWGKYWVTESKGIHIKLFYAEEKPILDFIIGKSNYEKPANPLLGDAKTDTYFRFTKNWVVYQTDGLMQKHLNRNLNDWRNKLITHLKSNEVYQIKFSYPDSSYILKLKDDQWICNQGKIDQSRVLKYISNVQFEDGYKFDNEFTPASEPLYSVTFIGKDHNELTQLNCYKIDNINYVIHSSQNENSYFRAKENDLVNQFFKSQNYFKKR